MPRKPGNAATKQRNARAKYLKYQEYEISPIPPVANVMRRIRCEADPVLWLETYLPGVFTCEFSESQREFVKACWNAILERGYQNINAYRGFGKTSILSGLLLMSHLTGHTRHAIYITAEGRTSTKAASEFFQSALTEDDGALFEDYPEVLYPIKRRGGVAQRPIRYNGELCSIVLSPEEIVFPSIRGSVSNGSVIRFTSIGSSSIRGSHKSIRGEGTKRVDVVFLDDIQSDGTAKSEVEVDNIMQTIKSTVKFLAGRTKTGGKEPLIILSAMTQNQQDDVAVRMITEHPEFCTRLIRFCKSLPSDFTPWIRYRDFYRESYQKLKNKAAVQKTCADYYQKHKAEIEDGVEVDNPQLYEPGQVSAIQYALEFWCSDQHAFWCELQNDAIRAAQETGEGLAPIVVQRKTRSNEDVSGKERALRRYWIPKWADVMTAFIDCGEHYLNYQVTAFRKNLSAAHVVDFGVFPEQRTSTTSKKGYTVDLQACYKTGDKFERLSQAVTDCLTLIFNQQYFDYCGVPVEVNQETDFLQNARAQGAPRQYFRFLSLCGVDAGDGEMEMAVWRGVDKFHQMENGWFAGRAIPTYGHAAERRLLRYWPLKPGEYRRGRDNQSDCDWIENPERCRGILKRFPNVYASLMFDANTAKSRRESAWMTPIERSGAESLFEWSDIDYVKMFAQHQCAETYDRVWLSNVQYKRWKEKTPRVSDNEFLDTDTGCWALASYVGCQPELIPTVRPRRPKVSREESMAQAMRRLNGGHHL